MTKKVTFHKHEIVGATMAYNFMKRIGFDQKDIEKVTKLIRYHQFRFYSDTKPTTIRSWLQKLGRDCYPDIIHVRLADRAGNDKNENKPVITKEIQQLKDLCDEMIQKKEVVFPEDLVIKKHELFKLDIPKQYHKEAMANMLAIVQAKPARNCRQYLVKYLKENYGKGK